VKLGEKADSAVNWCRHAGDEQAKSHAKMAAKL
jgi:hypothetical protein